MIEKRHNEAAERLKALANPIRLKLLENLLRGECCVGVIQDCLDISQPNTSQHVKILKKAGIIEGRRERNKICYRITDESTKKILKIIFKGDK